MVEMLVMPKKASKSAQDFWSLYNSKIFNANKKDKVVKIIGANEKIRDWEKTCDIKNNNHAITFNFKGLRDEDAIKESPKKLLQKVISFKALKLFT